MTRSSKRSSRTPFRPTLAGIRSDGGSSFAVVTERSDSGAVPIRHGRRRLLEGLGLEPLIDVNELAAYLGVPVSTVYDWRTRGAGPRAHRFGKHLKFALSDVRTWVEQQRDPEPPAGEGR